MKNMISVVLILGCLLGAQAVLSYNFDEKNAALSSIIAKNKDVLRAELSTIKRELRFEHLFAFVGAAQGAQAIRAANSEDLLTRLTEVFQRELAGEGGGGGAAAGVEEVVVPLAALEVAQRLTADELILRRYGYGAEAIVEIKPNLFLSSYSPAENLELLKELGITHILNLTGYKRGSTTELRYPPKFPGKFSYLHLVHSDENTDELMKVYLKEVIQPGHRFLTHALLDPKSKVIVHCEAGISRSSTMVISWLMARHEMNLKQAFDFVHSKKRNIAPNDGFFGVLRRLELNLARNGRLPAQLIETPSYSVEDYKIEQLMVMSGKDRARVVAALLRANGNPDTASAYLFE